MNIIGILGFAQTGKDTIFKILDKHGYGRIAFADPVKRVCQEVFQFSYNQLWGTLEEKEAPDFRYPREHIWSMPYWETPEYKRKCLCCGKAVVLDGEGLMPETDFGQCYLTPRYAMKRMGTEGARASWDDIWVSKGLADARLVLQGCAYDRVLGVRKDKQVDPPKGIILTDCRFFNEVDRILEHGGRVYRVKRPGFDQPMFDHASETEQLQISDDELSGVIQNDGTLEDLEQAVLAIVGTP